MFLLLRALTIFCMVSFSVSISICPVDSTLLNIIQLGLAERSVEKATQHLYAWYESVVACRVEFRVHLSFSFFFAHSKRRREVHLPLLQNHGFSQKIFKWNASTFLALTLGRTYQLLRETKTKNLGMGSVVRTGLLTDRSPSLLLTDLFGLCFQEGHRKLWLRCKRGSECSSW